MSVVVVIQTAEEAPGLVRWGLRFAAALEAEKTTLITIDHGSGVEAIEAAIAQTAELDPGEQLLEIAAPDPESPSAVLKHLEKLSPGLLLVGKQQSRRNLRGPAQLARALFERANCRTILLRLGSSDGDLCRRVLIPIGGGPHAREALRLAVRTAGEEAEIHALRVHANIGEDSEAIGEHILGDMVRGAGLTELESDQVQLRVTLNDDISAGIRRTAEADNFDLLLIGASNGARLRKWLFGAIPDRLMKSDGGLAVGVVRDQTPVGRRIRAAFERFLQFRVPQLDRDARIAVVERLQDNSRWNFDFMTLIALSTLIAAFGLIQNSPAVVIGAMLVAPLMTPLLGAGLALVQGNRALIRDCLRSIGFGFIAALIVGVFAGFAASGLNHLNDLTHELRSRGGPTLLDLGVALASGIAAAYCVARPGLSSALAGVAIAAALVPPIATVGISISLGEMQNALGASLLFATNVVAIVLGAAFSFFAGGIRGSQSPGHRWGRRAAVGLLAAAMILTIPLSTKLISTPESTPSTTPTAEPKKHNELRAGIQQLLADDSGEAEFRDLRLTRTAGFDGVRVSIELSTLDLSVETIDAVRTFVSDRVPQKPVMVEFRAPEF
ncbi:MAG: putative hydrophobic protein (TIGR00271 family) [Verrucomicrobiales bacterium]|jgi:uncharacterized hydrophobic protein (TIGR00271 family)